MVAVEFEVSRCIGGVDGGVELAGASARGGTPGLLLRLLS